MSATTSVPESLDWSRRVSGREWMDEPCSYEQFRDCLRDLERSNRLTFTYRPTLHWLSHLPAATAPLHIVDVGCGGGDMLRQIHTWAQRRKRPVRLTGIDLNPYAAAAARERTPQAMNIEWITGDAFSYSPSSGIDLVISSLFTHHLENEEIVSFLRWMERSARVGWFINDLHRKPNPYYAFRLLAKLARFHPFVQHDGPLSIRRSFQVQDWQHFLNDAGLPPQAATIQPYWPARLCVSRVK